MQPMKFHRVLIVGSSFTFKIKLPSWLYPTVSPLLDALTHMGRHLQQSEREGQQKFRYKTLCDSQSFRQKTLLILSSDAQAILVKGYPQIPVELVAGYRLLLYSPDQYEIPWHRAGLGWAAPTQSYGCEGQSQRKQKSIIFMIETINTTRRSQKFQIWCPLVRLWKTQVRITRHEGMPHRTRENLAKKTPVSTPGATQEEGPSETGLLVHRGNFMGLTDYNYSCIPFSVILTYVPITF